MTVLDKLRSPQRLVVLSRRVQWPLTAAFMLYLCIAPLTSAPYANFDRSMVMIYVVVGLGLNVLTGLTGQISLGHGAFFALGAYVAAVLVNQAGWHYLLVLPTAAVAAWVLGYVIGRPALRLQGLQLALITLALALITPSVIKRFDHITMGQAGIVVDTAQPPTWTGLERDQWVYYLCLAVAVAAYLVSRRLAAGRVGRSLVSIRNSEAVAATLGVRASVVKTNIFALSASFAGVAGALYAIVVQYVAPDAFGLSLAIAFITLIVVGGLGTPGAVFGAVFIVYLPSFTSTVNDSAASFIYGATLLLFMFFVPFGIVSLVRLFVHKVRHPRGPSEP